MLLESPVTSSRHSDLCTQGLIVNLYISCCSPFAVVTKHNDPPAAAYLCVPGVTVQCSSQSPDFVHFSHRCTHCLRHHNWRWQLVSVNWLLVLDSKVALVQIVRSIHNCGILIWICDRLLRHLCVRTRSLTRSGPLPFPSSLWWLVISLECE